MICNYHSMFFFSLTVVKYCRVSRSRVPMYVEMFHQDQLSHKAVDSLP